MINMTYQPNPDAPIASERHPELYERMCKARAFIEQVLSAYVKARKANGMTKPGVTDADAVNWSLQDIVEDELSITEKNCILTVGEGVILTPSKLEKLIEENWNGK